MTKNGVGFYIKAKITIEVNFPDGDVSCQWCRYHRYKTVNGHTRVICIETYEALENIDTQVGLDCPLELEVKDEYLSENCRSHERCPVPLQR